MLRLALCCLVLAACIERTEKEPITRATPAPSEVHQGKRSATVRQLEPRGAISEDATIVVRLASEPRHLNPLLAGDAVAVDLALGDVYEPLLMAQRAGERPVPHLASRYSKSPDGRTWTFFLRQGIRFHDGASLGPDDVVASFMLAKNAMGPLRGEFDDLESAAAGGATSVVLRFAGPRPGREEAIAMVPIARAAAFAGADSETLHRAAASKRPNGTGALRVTRFANGEIEMVRHEGYWGDKARSARVLYRVIPDRTRASAELRAGVLDVFMGLPVDEAITLAGSDETLTLVRRSLPAYTAAVFNTESSGLHARARRTLSRSFDRVSLIREIFRGYAEPAAGPFLRGGSREGPQPARSSFDLEAALAELRVAFGEEGGKLRLLVPNGSRTMERLADIWSADVHSVINIDVQHPEFADMLGRVRAGDFDIALLSFTTSADTDLYNLFHSSEIGRGNVSRLADPVVDELLEKLRRAGDDAELDRLSHSLSQHLLRLAPFAFLTTDSRLGVVRKSIGGVGDTATGRGARFFSRHEAPTKGVP